MVSALWAMLSVCVNQMPHDGPLQVHRTGRRHRSPAVAGHGQVAECSAQPEESQHEEDDDDGTDEPDD